jgi:hypothetical protein
MISSYNLKDNGITYDLEDGIVIEVGGKSARSVVVKLRKGDDLVPPETGNLGSSTFRDKLFTLAEGAFGEVNGFKKDIGQIAARLDDHLRERAAEAAKANDDGNVPEFLGTPYRISEEGGFVRIKHTEGSEVGQVLTNFVARVEEQVVRYDGAEEKRSYKISGSAGGRCLPTINVPVSQFSSMHWVSEHWGLEAHVTANQTSYAREAIELYSRDSPKRHRYAHTGWCKLEDGTRVFLHTKGAIA